MSRCGGDRTRFTLGGGTSAAEIRHAASFVFRNNQTDLDRYPSLFVGKKAKRPSRPPAEDPAAKPADAPASQTDPPEEATPAPGQTVSI